MLEIFEVGYLKGIADAWRGFYESKLPPDGLTETELDIWIEAQGEARVKALFEELW